MIMNKDEFDKLFDYYIEEEHGNNEYSEEGYGEDEDEWFPSGIYIQAYKGQEEIVEIPESVGDERVTLVASMGECSTIKHIRIPSTVDFLEGAFDGCPNMIDEDGNLVVRGKLLKTRTDCTILRVPEGIREIGGHLTNAELFSPNNTIEEIILPDGLEIIGGAAFNFCVKLRRIVFPKSLMEIEYNAFEGCSLLDSIVLPETLNRVGQYAFRDCEKLRMISIFHKTKCEEGAFQGCPSGDDGFTIINGILFSVNLNKVQDAIEIPNSVKKIDAFAFMAPTRVIPQITLTDNVQIISDDAFGILGVENIRLIDHESRKPIFETDRFAFCEEDLNSDNKFKEMCKIISNRDYRALDPYGTVYIGN